VADSCECGHELKGSHKTRVFVYWLRVWWPRSLDNEEALAQWGGGGAGNGEKVILHSSF